jgi:hypothetical protein
MKFYPFILNVIYTETLSIFGGYFIFHYKQNVQHGLKIKLTKNAKFAQSTGFTAARLKLHFSIYLTICIITGRAVTLQSV